MEVIKSYWKYFLMFIIIFITCIFIFSNTIYNKIDKAEFIYTYEIGDISTLTSDQKGILLLDSIKSQLEYELSSLFGWSANDILFNSYILDNRAYRQYGVYNATKILLDFYSTDIAKLGTNDRENDNLYSSRMNYFAINPSRWGILFIPSAESMYKTGLNLLNKYEEDLVNGNAVYNCRTDDIYNSLNLILGDRLLSYSIGLLQAKEDDMFYEIDNRVYEAQGTAIVIRNFLNALYKLYPEEMNKNNEENFKVAMEYLNKICSYNPLFITETFNSRELFLSWFLFAKNRIFDIKESIKI